MRHKIIFFICLVLMVLTQTKTYAISDCFANHYLANERPSLNSLKTTNEFYHWREAVHFSDVYSAKVALAQRSASEGPAVLVGFDIDDRAWQYDFLSTQWIEGGCGFYKKTTEARNANNVYNFKFWQYVDISYYFGHKLLTIPPTMWTNAAHKNGVKSLGTFNLNELNPDDVLNADKLPQTIATLNEIADSFGFDGYLINYEGNSAFRFTMPLLTLMDALKKKGLTIVWYDAPISGGFANYLNKEAMPFFTHAGFFQSNYWWDYPEGFPAQSYQTLIDFHQENQKNNVFQSGDVYRDPYKKLPLDRCDSDASYNAFFTRFKDIYKDDSFKVFYTGIGIYAPNWTLFGGKADPVTDTSIPSLQDFEQSDSAFWEGSGPYGCGHSDYRNMSHFLIPRTVIKELPFYSNFNTGVGEFYFTKGHLQSSGFWSNYSLQTILPTWQNVLSDSSRKDVNVFYDYKTVYDGGSSLKIEAANVSKESATIRLYRTNFNSHRNDQIDLVVKSSGSETISLIADKIKFIVQKTINLSSDWKQLTFMLPADIKIEELDIVIGPNSAGKINVNLGSIKIYNATELPKPRNQMALKNGYILSWKECNKGSSYQIYGVNAKGSAVLLNETYNSSYDLRGNIFNGTVDGTKFPSYLIKEVTVAGESASF